MVANPSPETRRSLLLRIRDPADQLAWSEFVDIYGPLIHAYARRRGLQEADATDIAQQVLQSVVQAAGGFRYDRSLDEWTKLWGAAEKPDRSKPISSMLPRTVPLAKALTPRSVRRNAPRPR